MSDNSWIYTNKQLKKALKAAAQVSSLARQELNIFAQLGVTNELISSIHQFTKQAKLVSGNFSEITQSGILESFQRISKGFIETEEDFKTFKALMVEMGFPPHGDLDIGTIRKIARTYTTDPNIINKDIVEALMIKYYNSNKLNTISNEWESNNHLSNRIHILRNVIMAHNLRMYNVSIPALIAQLEGLIVDSFYIKGQVDGKILKILLTVLLKKDNVKYYDFDDEIWKFYNKNILVGFEHGKSIQSALSRHAILHGGDKDYGTEANSLKAILLFDHISNAVGKIDEDMIRTAKDRVRNKRRGKNKKKK